MRHLVICGVPQNGETYSFTPPPKGICHCLPTDDRLKKNHKYHKKYHFGVLRNPFGYGGRQTKSKERFTANPPLGGHSPSVNFCPSKRNVHSKEGNFFRCIRFGLEKYSMFAQGRCLANKGVA